MWHAKDPALESYVKFASLARLVGGAVEEVLVEQRA